MKRRETVDKKKILFACIGNCCRSQMAEGFAKKVAGDRFDIYSAGTRPAGFVHPDAIAVMKELGIDISAQYSKGFNQVPAKNLDYLVTMGCEKTCPAVAAKKQFDWQIEDPIGQPIEVFRRVRDGIKARVEGFLSS
jgi:arsenate reductase